MNGGIYAIDSRVLVLQNNIIFQAVEHAISLDDGSNNGRIEYNLILGVYSPVVSTTCLLTDACIVTKFSAIYVVGQSGATSCLYGRRRNVQHLVTMSSAVPWLGFGYWPMMMMLVVLEFRT